MSKRVFVLTQVGRDPIKFLTEEDLHLYMEVNEINDGFTITKAIEE